MIPLFELQPLYRAYSDDVLNIVQRLCIKEGIEYADDMPGWVYNCLDFSERVKFWSDRRFGHLHDRMMNDPYMKVLCRLGGGYEFLVDAYNRVRSFRHHDYPVFLDYVISEPSGVSGLCYVVADLVKINFFVDSGIYVEGISLTRRAARILRHDYFEECLVSLCRLWGRVNLVCGESLGVSGVYGTAVANRYDREFGGLSRGKLLSYNNLRYCELMTSEKRSLCFS